MKRIVFLTLFLTISQPSVAQPPESYAVVVSFQGNELKSEYWNYIKKILYSRGFVKVFLRKIPAGKRRGSIPIFLKFTGPRTLSLRCGGRVQSFSIPHNYKKTENIALSAVIFLELFREQTDCTSSPAGIFENKSINNEGKNLKKEKNKPDPRRGISSQQKADSGGPRGGADRVRRRRLTAKRRGGSLRKVSKSTPSRRRATGGVPSPRRVSDSRGNSAVSPGKTGRLGRSGRSAGGGAGKGKGAKPSKTVEKRKLPLPRSGETGGPQRPSTLPTGGGDEKGVVSNPPENRGSAVGSVPSPKRGGRVGESPGKGEAAGKVGPGREGGTGKKRESVRAGAGSVRKAAAERAERGGGESAVSGEAVGGRGAGEKGAVGGGNISAKSAVSGGGKSAEDSGRLADSKGKGGELGRVESHRLELGIVGRRRDTWYRLGISTSIKFLEDMPLGGELAFSVGWRGFYFQIAGTLHRPLLLDLKIYSLIFSLSLSGGYSFALSSKIYLEPQIGGAIQSLWIAFLSPLNQKWRGNLVFSIPVYFEIAPYIWIFFSPGFSWSPIRYQFFYRGEERYPLSYWQIYINFGAAFSTKKR